jgi:hypothetical protein
VRLRWRGREPGWPFRKTAFGVLAVSDLSQRVESAVVFLDGVAIRQSAPRAPNGHHHGHADQHNQEQCAHLAIPSRPPG